MVPGSDDSVHQLFSDAVVRFLFVFLDFHFALLTNNDLSFSYGFLIDFNTVRYDLSNEHSGSS